MSQLNVQYDDFNYDDEEIHLNTKLINTRIYIENKTKVLLNKILGNLK